MGTPSGLDAKFGPCVEPVYFNDAERSIVQLTIFELDAPSARRIARFIEMSKDKGRFSIYPFVDFSLLWLVTEYGEIRIAVEEGVLPESTSGEKRFPLPNAIKRNYVKLGHPALVQGAHARIGGEIGCDLETDPAQWYITNRSGRYGVNLGRTEAQLANVAAEFAKLG
jgi:hypothetical protein